MKCMRLPSRLWRGSEKFDDSSQSLIQHRILSRCPVSHEGRKNSTLGELKESMTWIKSQMSREKRLNDVFTFGLRPRLGRGHR
jgi:hypothetical protein